MTVADGPGTLRSWTGPDQGTDDTTDRASIAFENRYREYSRVSVILSTTGPNRTRPEFGRDLCSEISAHLMDLAVDSGSIVGVRTGDSIVGRI